MVKHNAMLPFDVNMRVYIPSRKKQMRDRAQAALRNLSISDNGTDAPDYKPVLVRDAATITLRSKVDKPENLFSVEWNSQQKIADINFKVDLRNGYSYSILVIPRYSFVYVRAFCPAEDANPYIRLVRALHLLGELRTSAGNTVVDPSQQPHLNDPFVPPVTQLARMARIINQRDDVRPADTLHPCIEALLDVRLISHENELMKDLCRGHLLQEMLCPCAASLLTAISADISTSFSEKVDGFNLTLYDVVVRDHKDTPRSVTVQRITPLCGLSNEIQQHQQREAAVQAFSQCISALLIIMNEEARLQDQSTRRQAAQDRDKQRKALQYFYRITIFRLAQTQTALCRMMNGLTQVLQLPVVQILPKAVCHDGCMLTSAMCTFDGCLGSTILDVWSYLNWRLSSKV